MALNAFKKIVNPVINYLGRKKFDSKFENDPIIIGGCGRSGTTLLLSIISAHPNIFAFPREIGIFSEWHKGRPRLDRLYRYVLIHKIPNECNRWCEKTPANVRYFDRILDYFQGKVKLIHIVRDGRDVMLSRHPKDPDKYWVSPERWVNDVKAGLKFKENSRVLTIKYENLIMNFKVSLEKICDFIDEECREELYNWHDNTAVKKNEAWGGSVKELHAESIGKYKKPENRKRVKEVMKNEKVVELLKELNYSL
ncbi:MAG: sulfotransferase family protein [Halanaerobiales bacterium]